MNRFVFVLFALVSVTSAEFAGLGVDLACNAYEGSSRELEGPLVDKVVYFRPQVFERAKEDGRCTNRETLLHSQALRLFCGFSFAVTQRDRVVDGGSVCLNKTLDRILSTAGKMREDGSEIYRCSCFAFDTLGRKKREMACANDDANDDDDDDNDGVVVSSERLPEVYTFFYDSDGDAVYHSGVDSTARQALDQWHFFLALVCVLFIFLAPLLLPVLNVNVC